MNWFFIALISPFLESIINFIDKFLLSKYFKEGGYGALLIFSSLIGGLVTPFIFIFKADEILSIGSFFIFISILNGIIFVLSLLPYLKSLEKNEVSTVAPLIQMTPFFGLILAFIVLGEVLSVQQVIAGLLIVTGAFLISLNTKTFKLNKELLILMAVSSFLLALNDLLFKFVAIEIDFWTTVFWNYIGFLLVGLTLFLFKDSYRRDFMSVLKSNSTKAISINTLNEAIAMVSMITFGFATLLAPLAMVQTVSGLQPFFTLFISFVLATILPNIFKEKLDIKSFLQKLISVIIILIGVLLLFN
ncbi:MAG: drug/metabolite transporter (DMT)-like permease [Candidatus Paceibacteria bacterium]|jgi:drug/metabolite transporter (DMT)-like permease